MSASSTSAWPASPAPWAGFDGLFCGFGSRVVEAPAGTLLLRRQVHGADIVDASAFRPPFQVDSVDGRPRLPVDADAVVVDRPGVAAGVRTADCVPLLLVSPERRWAAAVHAGWRGTVARIAQRAVEAASRAGVPASALHAALGPSIGPCCYEVSPDLGRRFEQEGLSAGVRPGGLRPHLDLRLANRVLLEGAGLASSRIVEVGPCTRCAAADYHSYRADPTSDGRQVSWIGWEGRRP